MKDFLKNSIKQVLRYFRFSLTKNQRYDVLTQQVIQRVCHPESHCIDVGCHKGEVLDLMLKYAPQGCHYGFEPVPALFSHLVRKYRDQRCLIYDVALSNRAGMTSFNYVVSNPAYSGLRRRTYDRAHEQEQEIQVRQDCLDHLIPVGERIALIKIDVEGGELQVLEGARRILEQHRPVVIFEHGLGASDCYNTTPDQVFDLFSALGYRVMLLEDFLHNHQPLTKSGFETQFYQRLNYYFVAV